MGDEAFPHVTLLRRSVTMNEEYGVAVETSLYRSNVTGVYLLEEIQHGRHGATASTVTLTPSTVADLLPLLARIAAGEAV
jgi:hypothetical protein